MFARHADVTSVAAAHRVNGHARLEAVACQVVMVERDHSFVVSWCHVTESDVMLDDATVVSAIRVVTTASSAIVTNTPSIPVSRDWLFVAKERLTRV